ncbi:MAG: hypothetical protein IKD69_10230 [Solobacterium sp.]|jgi:cellobiose-specific phosphotransferase system component IIB|nr:hypothetical protein [Solobacterium sp.]
MLRIAISCGEGFASGYLSRYLATATIKENLQDQVHFIFIPVHELYERQDEADIAFLLPHVEPIFKSDKREYHIPVYIVPFKVVIKPKVADYLADAEDIMAMADGKGGLYCFPGESHTAMVSRLVCHRTWVAQQEDKKKKERK